MTSVSMNEELRLPFQGSLHSLQKNKWGLEEGRTERPAPQLVQHHPLSCEAWRKHFVRGRSPDWQVIAKPAAFPSRQAGTVAFKRRFARCSQWRNRAGITPASLFTHRFKVSTSGQAHVYHNGRCNVKAVAEVAVAEEFSIDEPQFENHWIALRRLRDV